MGNTRLQSQAERLESLWGGAFGNRYTRQKVQLVRNQRFLSARRKFWKALCSRHRFQNVLEVGCGLGPNLLFLAEQLPPERVFGVDVNGRALAFVRKKVPNVNPVWSAARSLPFRDGYFGLVFTCGVLIHQPDESLPLVMREVVRCSNRYVLCMEYFSKKMVEVPYRSEREALFKRDYGGLYRENFRLKLLRRGLLTRSQGWDDITYWLFEKTKRP